MARGRQGAVPRSCGSLEPRSTKREQPGLVQHHRDTVPFPTHSWRHIRHEPEIRHRRVPIEVLLGIADQHDVFCEEIYDLVEVVRGEALFKLGKHSAGAPLGILTHGRDRINGGSISLRRLLYAPTSRAAIDRSSPDARPLESLATGPSAG